MSEAGVAIFAKAPIPGFAKTRLIPTLGEVAAARLQEVLTERAVETALAARVGAVMLWCAPDASHPAFAALAQRFDIALADQPSGDLGARMLRAFADADRPLVLIGADCPCLEPNDLCAAAAALEGADVVIAPAEDGGYGLIAAARPMPALFSDMPWSTDQVAALTRARAAAAGLTLHELRPVWDVDVPADYARLAASGLLGPRLAGPVT